MGKVSRGLECSWPSIKQRELTGTSLNFAYQPMIEIYIGANSNVFGMVKKAKIKRQSAAKLHKKNGEGSTIICTYKCREVRW